MNYIKRVIFRFWFEWHRITRMKFGSNRIPFILFKIFGRASYTVEGVKMHLSPYEFFWRQMMEGKIESGTVLSAINKYLPQNGTLLDVGANIGFFTCWASVNKNANVFAIEPSLRELMVLRMNIKHNNSSNIEVFPFAVG